MKKAVICFTKNGEKLANMLKQQLNDVDVFIKPVKIYDFTKSIFDKYDALIFISATGIAVRAISPSVKSKFSDPAVIVLDELGNFVIPILSGHLGGANELSLEISQKINATPVITTATDVNNKISIDVFAKKNNLYFEDVKSLKLVSSEILSGEVGLASDYTVENLPNYIKKDDFNQKIGIVISNDITKKPFEITLNLVPKNKILGVGCKKNTDSLDFEQFILKNIDNINEILEIRSIDLKANEPCILNFSEKYKIPFKFFTKDELLQVEGEFSSSEFVKSVTGVDCVCERSASFYGEDIILRKVSENGKTLAISQKEVSFNFEY